MMAVAWLATGAMASSGDPDRRLTVEDLLGLEAFGRADISPDGRWADYEKRAGYNTMTEVRLGGRSTWTIMDLWLADLKEPPRHRDAFFPLKDLDCNASPGPLTANAFLLPACAARPSSTGSSRYRTEP